MQMLKLLRYVVLVAAALVPMASHADDTDIFTQSTGSSASAVNILFVIDNTANWSKASQQWIGSPTQGEAELRAIARFVAKLGANTPPTPANVGLMMLTTNGGTKRDGGYVRFGIRDMSQPTNVQAWNALTTGIYGSAITVDAPDEKIDQSSGDYANALYEAWLYLTGASSSWAGMDPLADYAGNPGTKKDPLTTSALGLTGGFAYKGSANGSGYNSPLGGGCGKTYIIFIGNNRQGQLPPVPAATDPSMTTLAKYNYATSTDVQSTWARFLKDRPDLGLNTPAAQNGSVITFTIDAYNAQNNPAFTTMMGNMANQGGGTYFQANSDDALNIALDKIAGRILAVNSVFASVSLPVSVSVRGTYLNQVYLGMFRPDANSSPNWVGNLKQYQLATNTATTPPTVYLADAKGAAVENTITGFVNPEVTSIWTASSTFWDPLKYANSQGAGGISDAPDGDLVEKGGAGEYLRTTFATSQTGRFSYTCTGTCGAGSYLSQTPFDTSNTSLTAAALGLASGTPTEPVVNWIRGGNTLMDDPKGVANPGVSKTPPYYNVRGFVHGDVLHSRPAVINYNRNPDDVVVFYGSNDGMLHAVKGGPSSQGQEYWNFIAPEHFSQFGRMYSHAPTITSTTPKPYFVDGSATTYTYSTKGDGIIDSTRGDKAYLFVTMRRGGRFMYAFDVSDPQKPALLWKHSNTDPGFAELGQTWSDLRVAKIRASSNPVLIFGLGYDPAANDPVVQQPATMGRGVMVLDAVTGKPIWQAGPTAAVGTNMAYAIPANMAIIDSDRDGYADRVYAADTGANIWRININDADSTKWTVTLLASLGGTGVNARKFLFAPDVVPQTTTNPYDTVLIGSGDREHPLNTTTQNRYYMINDDHALYAQRSTPIVEGPAGATTGTAGQLFDVTTDTVQVGTSDQIAAAKAALTVASGWYITLQPGEKVVSGSTTLSGTVIFSTNMPQAASPNSCTGNMGEARIYMVNYLNGAASYDANKSGGLTAADRYQVRAGGGYPPTPVPVSVKIGNNIYNVAISGTQVITPPGPVLGRRYRIFWRKGID